MNLRINLKIPFNDMGSESSGALWGVDHADCLNLLGSFKKLILFLTYVFSPVKKQHFGGEIFKEF